MTEHRSAPFLPTSYSKRDHRKRGTAEVHAFCAGEARTYVIPIATPGLELMSERGGCDQAMRFVWEMKDGMATRLARIEVAS